MGYYGQMKDINTKVGHRQGTYKILVLDIDKWYRYINTEVGHYGQMTDINSDV